MSNNKIEKAIIASNHDSVSKIRKLNKILNKYKLQVFNLNDHGENISIEQTANSNDKLSLREIEFFLKRTYENLKIQKF